MAAETRTVTFKGPDGSLQTATISPGDGSNQSDLAESFEGDSTRTTASAATASDGDVDTSSSVVSTTTPSLATTTLITVFDGRTYTGVVTMTMDNTSRAAPSSTSASTALLTPEACDLSCTDAVSALDEYGVTDELCGAGFKKSADTCLDCVRSDNASDDLVQQWQKRLGPGIEHCQEPGPNIGAIVGGVVGGILGAAAVCTAFFFLYRRRKRRRACLGLGRSDTWKKPELHADDYQPHREELEGSRVPQNLLEKKHGAVVEMPANEDVRREHELDSSATTQVEGDRSQVADSSTPSRPG